MAPDDELVWVYDARSGTPVYGKRQPLTRAVFADFERAFGDDPYGQSPRVDEGPQGRFRPFALGDLERKRSTLMSAGSRCARLRPISSVSPQR